MIWSVSELALADGYEIFEFLYRFLIGPMATPRPLE
jgi:hypothetical protein